MERSEDDSGQVSIDVTVQGEKDFKRKRGTFQDQFVADVAKDLDLQV